MKDSKFVKEMKKNYQVKWSINLNSNKKYRNSKNLFLMNTIDKLI